MARETDELPPSKGENIIPVLFIAGMPRSGSTLLDRVIGMHDGFFSVGESQFIWERAFRQNQLCGCGVPFLECPYWQKVSELAFGASTGGVDATAAIKLQKRVDHTRFLPSLILPRRSASQQRALYAYGDKLERLYRAILGTSGARVIVDSSKDPRHGFLLSRLPRIKLHVVHLIRDPRAVAFSWTRTRERPEIHWKAQSMPTQKVNATAIRWTARNAMLELLSAYADTYTKIRYEDFVTNPQITLSRLLAPYEWVEHEKEQFDLSAVDLKPTHTVSGNPMRFNHGRLKLELDNEWLYKMSTWDRVSTSMVTAPFLRRYGYQFRVRP